MQEDSHQGKAKPWFVATSLFPHSQASKLSPKMGWGHHPSPKQLVRQSSAASIPLNPQHLQSMPQVKGWGSAAISICNQTLQRSPSLRHFVLLSSNGIWLGTGRAAPRIKGAHISCSLPCCFSRVWSRCLILHSCRLLPGCQPVWGQFGAAVRPDGRAWTLECEATCHQEGQTPPLPSL